MTDNDLSDEVWTVITGLIVMAVLLFIIAKPYEKWGFMKDCADTYSKDECLELWRIGNE